MKTGFVFASTGGDKIIRAIRSFQRMELVPAYVTVDVSSKTYNSENQDAVREFLDRQPNLQVRYVTNTSYINGNLNAAMRWMMEFGYEYACLLHDDVIFSPLQAHLGSLSKWCDRLEDPSAKYDHLRRASAICLGYVQTFLPNDVWKQSPQDWSKIDLESEQFWYRLFPDRDDFCVDWWKREDGGCRLYNDDLHFFFQSIWQSYTHPSNRLGPPGQIVPLKQWSDLGGFDETDGIYYDVQYPAECAVRGLPPFLTVPNIPFLHLHNQSIGYADPSNGIWLNLENAFTKRYGAPMNSFWDAYPSWMPPYHDWRTT